MNVWIVKDERYGAYIDFEKLTCSFNSKNLFRFRKLGPDNLQQELEAISESYLYASTFDKLNDPMEAFFGVVSHVNQGDSMEDIISAAIVVGNGLKKINSETGIISLTDSVDNMVLWAYYADNFSGICLEFDLFGLCCGDLFHKGPYIINYVKSPPQYHNVSIDMCSLIDTHFHTNFLTKSIDWKHESEFRFLTNPGKNYYPKHALRRIWLGPRNEYVDMFLDFGRFHNIEIVQTRAQDYKLMSSGAMFNFSPMSNGLCLVMQDFFHRLNTFNKIELLNNIDYVFNRSHLKKDSTLISLNLEDGELIAEIQYSYSAGIIRRCIEVYDFSIFEGGPLWGQDMPFPKKLISLN